METLQQFITILIPLIIIMDPPGNLLFFFGLTGDFVLHFFNIGLPAFQIAGGFIFFIYALQMLRLIPSNIRATQQEEKEGIEKHNVALVPLATPLLAGPGAITAVLVWQQTPESSVSISLLLLAIILTCFIVYIVFYFGEWIRKVLGVGGLQVVTRLMGLLLAVIAVQFMVAGFQQLR